MEVRLWMTRLASRRTIPKPNVKLPRSSADSSPTVGTDVLGTSSSTLILMTTYSGIPPTLLEVAQGSKRLAGCFKASQNVIVIVINIIIIRGSAQAFFWH